MAYNKVVYGGNTLIDLTADTVTESAVAQGYTFHKCDGTSAVGTAQSGGIPDTITAGDTPVYQYFNTSALKTGTSYSILPQYTYIAPYSGTYRVKFLFCAASTSYDAYVKIYVNGTAVGAEHHSGGTVETLVAEDIQVVAGDEIQLYGYCKGGFGAAQNFYIVCSSICIDWQTPFLPTA